MKNAKPGRPAAGRGLYLLLREGGSRSWVLRTQVGGKRQDLGLGSAAKLSLAQARAKASELRTKIKSGEDIRAKARAPKQSVPTFAQAARACHEAIKGGWANKRHSDSWLSSLENHVFPAFGATPVDRINSVVVRDALAPIWLSSPETARGILQRIAVWPEFDLKAQIWSIPAARMKMKKPHVVPLSPAAVAILKRRWRSRAEDQGLVFSTNGTRPLSDMTMTKVLRDLGHDKVTVRGFRNSFTDWAAEKTRTPKEVVDKALAHKLVDRVEAAYRRTDFFERRRLLMRAWAEFVVRAPNRVVGKP